MADGVRTLAGRCADAVSSTRLTFQRSAEGHEAALCTAELMSVIVSVTEMIGTELDEPSAAHQQQRQTCESARASMTSPAAAGGSITAPADRLDALSHQTAQAAAALASAASRLEFPDG